MNITEKLKIIPNNPGVYQFKDKKGNIIYIGKAQNLSNRVKSYFNKTNDVKILALKKKIIDIECIITENDIEALLLENNLIKKHQPRYNIQLRDAKSYPMLKITDENLPKIIKCREKINKNGEYFGPFISVNTVKLLQKIFSKVLKIRTCKKKFKKPYNYTPCLNYHIGKCSGPCASLISENDYQINIEYAKRILKGETDDMIKTLNAGMMEYSEKKDYEQAANIRDQIKILNEYHLLQYMDTGAPDNSDFIGLYSDYKTACITVIQQRSGKIVGKENFIITKIIDFTEILYDFLNSYYLNITIVPSIIFISENIDNASSLEKALSLKYNGSVLIKKPDEIKDKKILVMAKENAELFYEEKQYKMEKLNVLRELKKALNLPRIPKIIEGIDIATLSGKYNVGSLVHFNSGKPVYSQYRQFNITGKGHPDDYAMISEVTARRYQKIKNENLKKPDLLLIDGGKGQLNAAKDILDMLKLDIPVIGLAKKEEHIYLPYAGDPVILSKSSQSLKLLQRVRDEAHRFSNTRLARRQKSGSLKSELMKIEGIGKKRLNLLIKTFGSLKLLKEKTADEIASVKGINKELAEKIRSFLSN